jgi:hypothetical protein
VKVASIDEERAWWREHVEAQLREIKGSLNALVDRSAEFSYLRDRVSRLETGQEKTELRIRALEDQAPMNRAVTNGVKWVLGLCLAALVSALLGLVIARPSYSPPPTTSATSPK